MAEIALGGTWRGLVAGIGSSHERVALGAKLEIRGTPRMVAAILSVLLAPLAAFGSDLAMSQDVSVSVKLDERRHVEMVALIEAIASATNVRLELPKARLALPTTGLGGSLTRTLLQESLGSGLSVESLADELRVTIPADRLTEIARAQWLKSLKGLVSRVERESQRRTFYGLYARDSYRPNDPSRPTICLIHGMNSTSSVFLHMVKPIEDAGYGVVVYDYPYNRDVDETVVAFRRDWNQFRARVGEKRPWAIVSHSMGTLLARDLVESPGYGNDVATLILIAPVNGGSYLAKAQTVLQFLQGVQSLNGKTRSDPLAHLGDGMGAAADDLTPGSGILTRLAGYSRREHVPYHIIAGDAGLITEAVRSQVINRMGMLARLSGPSLVGQLDELTDGRGDGCVAVERTKLSGVADHHVMHANHLELIRAPLLYPEPGPVVSLPLVLQWLKADLAPTSSPPARP